MKLRNRSLFSDAEDAEAAGSTWAVFGDLALALLLVLVLFVLAQFLSYSDAVVLEELDRRRAIVENVVRTATSEVLGPNAAELLEIQNVGFTTQRITFPEPMLFESCGTIPRDDGQRLIEAVGRGIGAHIAFFRAVQIEGHADRIVPTGECQLRVRDNWGLSSLRATEFLRILIGPAVFPEARIVSAVGRGDTQPRTAPDAGTDALEPDRRVELILIYSEEAVRQALQIPVTAP